MAKAMAAGVLGGLLLGNLGCRHAPPRVTYLKPPSASPPVEVESTPAPGVPETAPPPLPPSPPRIEPPPYRKTERQGWLTLEQWTSECGLPGFRIGMLRTNEVASWRLPQGELVLVLGRQPARWQGAEVLLGHAPKYLRGKPALHALDANKTLWPLITDMGQPLVTNRVVVIDPGHGGSNPGTTNAFNGEPEKVATLDWALRLRPLLERQGWEVHLTRTQDRDLSAIERIRVAEACQAGVFLSLHFNGGNGRPDISGIETYSLTPTGMPSTMTRGYAEDEAEVLPSHEHDEASLRWAMRVQRTLVQRTGATDRGVRRTRFMGVLRGQSRPAILVEGGFLTHPREARLIATAEYRQRLAEALAAAFGDFALSPSPVVAARRDAPVGPALKAGP